MRSPPATPAWLIATGVLFSSLSLVPLASAVSEGLHLAYDFETSLTAADCSGNGRHGAYHGSIRAGQGHDSSSSLGPTFDWSNHVSIPSEERTFAVGTVEAWVLVSSYKNEEILWWNGDGAGIHFAIVDDGRLEARVGDAETNLRSTRTVPLGSWAHVALAWTGTSLGFFIDGSPAGSYSHPRGASVIGEATIGAGGGDWLFSGHIDDFAIYDLAKQTFDAWGACRTPTASACFPYNPSALTNACVQVWPSAATVTRPDPQPPTITPGGGSCVMGNVCLPSVTPNVGSRDESAPGARATGYAEVTAACGFFMGAYCRVTLP